MGGIVHVHTHTHTCMYRRQSEAPSTDRTVWVHLHIVIELTGGHGKQWIVVVGVVVQDE